MGKDKVFINYRRGDSAGFTGRIHQFLANRIGNGRLFFDVEHIGAGRDFKEEIEEKLEQAKVTLVIIGPKWTSYLSERKEEEDLVAYEISQVLRSGRQVIPVLIEGATMPDPSELPEEIRGLASRNAVNVSHENFPSDMEMLANAMDIKVPKSAVKPGSWLFRLLVLIALAFVTVKVLKKGPQGNRSHAEIFHEVDNSQAVLKVYSEPNNQSEPFLFLRPPQKVIVLEEKPIEKGKRGVYYKVSIDDGWAAKDLEDADGSDPNFEYDPIPENPVPGERYDAVILLTNDELNVREGPNIFSGKDAEGKDIETPIRCKLLGGSKIKVIHNVEENRAHNHIWYHLEIPSGWIYIGSQGDPMSIKLGAW